jgi:hypothetical protein
MIGLNFTQECHQVKPELFVVDNLCCAHITLCQFFGCICISCFLYSFISFCALDMSHSPVYLNAIMMKSS